jgi:hypothetical protein
MKVSGKVTGGAARERISKGVERRRAFYAARLVPVRWRGDAALTAQQAPAS